MLISSVLFRAFLLGIGLLMLSGMAILFLTDQIYSVFSNMLDIPLSEYKAILISGLAHMKMLLFTFFLVPAIAIRWALKKAY